MYNPAQQVHIFNNNTLGATVGVEVGSAKYIGYITIDYSFKEGEFKADKILFAIVF